MYWAAACLLVVACSKSSDPDLKDDIALNEVKVLKAGKADSTMSLQLAFQQGSRQEIDNTVDMKISVSAGGESHDQSMSFSTTTVQTVDKVTTDDGSRVGHLSANITNVRADKLPPQATKAMRDMKMKMAIDPRGKLRKFDIDGNYGSKVRDMVKQQMNQAMTAFPDIPTDKLGVGASWKTKKTMNIMGGKGTIILKYTLTKIETGAKGRVAHLALTGKLDLNMKMGPATGDVGGKLSGKFAYIPSSARTLSANMTMRMDGRLKARGESAKLKGTVKFDAKERSWSVPSE